MNRHETSFTTFIPYLALNVSRIIRGKHASTPRTKASLGSLHFISIHPPVEDLGEIFRFFPEPWKSQGGGNFGLNSRVEIILPKYSKGAFCIKFHMDRESILPGNSKRGMVCVIFWFNFPNSCVDIKCSKPLPVCSYNKLALWLSGQSESVVAHLLPVIS